MISAYRHSYFPPSAIVNGGLALASVRAGNVIGGGDWAADRLIPDLVRAFERGEAPVIRSPAAVRPWQHVLEALGGYLQIAERLAAGEAQFADAWNFGPSDDDARPVSWIVERMQAVWGGGVPDAVAFGGEMPHEAGLLRLDCSKARAALGWRPALRLETALDWIVDWHKKVGAGADPSAITWQQIKSYMARSSATPPLVVS